ncbi:MAG: Sensory box histidine kinase [Solirubrobacterales bacterium]|nr:Sensory box histidine kinase [Solirubrobacterales bacterium]
MVDEAEELVLPAEPASVPQLRSAARRWAERVGLSDGQVSDVALAVSEAATNAVVHAFVGQSPGVVGLHLRVDEGRALVCVHDDGRGLTPRIDSPGLGLGLPTIGRIADHMDVGAGPEGGTEVRMAFNAPGLGDPAGALRQRLAGAYEGIDEMVLVHDEEGSFVYGNALALAFLGGPTVDELAARVPGETAVRFAITLPDGSQPALEDWPHRRLFSEAQRPALLLARSVELTSGRTFWTETTASLLIDEPTGRRLSLGLVRDVTASVEAERRSRLLIEAGRRLQVAAVDLEGTFQEICGLAVPELADWCAVDIADERGVLRRVGLAHRDPDKAALGRAIHERWPPDPTSQTGAYGVLRTGEPLVVPELTDDMLAAVEDREYREALQGIGMRSVLVLALRGRTRPVGVLTLVTADSRRTFDEDLIAFAGGLAAQAGVAVENARLIGARAQERGV